MGAVLSREEVAREVRIGELGTTFGGGPLACAAGLAVLEVLEQEGLVAHAARMEEAARRLLVCGPITGIRGRGLLLGLESRVPAKEVCAYLREQGILAGTSSRENVLRLMPPLVVQEDDLSALATALANYPGVVGS